MAHTLTVGSIRCHIVNDGLHHMDGGGFFGLVPRTLWQRVVTPDADNRIPVETRCLLIESNAGLILVDTGHGDKVSAKGRAHMGLGPENNRLIDDMASVGFRPEDVDLVLLTHFHGDHAGGATRFAEGEGGPIIPTFPRARYIGQRVDLADACYPNERTAATYVAENFKPLLAERLDVVDGPQRLARGVRTEIAPGHTAALQMVWVEDGGEALLFLGDAANWAVHLERLAWVPSYDVFPLTSIETKRAVRAEAMERDALLVFQHDEHVVTARLEAGPKGPIVRPVVVEPPRSV